MGLLAIETTGPIGSVALYNNEKFSEMATETEMSHLKEIVPLCNKLLLREAVATKELEAIAVDVGPGSFTGIRIGVVTVKTMAQLLNIPVIPVNSIEVWREKALDITEDFEAVAVIYNARRGQVYGGIYGKNEEEIMPAGAYMLTDIIDKLKEKNIQKVRFFGDGIDAYEEDIAGAEKLNGVEISFACVDDRYQGAEMLLRYVMRRKADLKAMSYEQVEPCYMREAEAMVRLREGTLGKSNGR